MKEQEGNTKMGQPSLIQKQPSIVSPIQGDNIKQPAYKGATRTISQGGMSNNNMSQNKTPQ